MFTFDFAVLTAVSLQDQATEDKDSLNFQLNRARDFGERMGGTFTREYRADGFSRSGWYDLTPALEACEAFNELARDARSHLFDVVIVESYDRLGDLGIFFFNYFAAHGPPYHQIISVQQKIMIEDPALYHPRRDDSIPSAIAESLKVNKYRTNKVFRAFEVGIPKRARDGKFAVRLPSGYTFTGDKKNYKVELDPIFKAKLIDAKDKYLQGWTLPALATLTGWKRNTIKEMLRNPFYAGKTYYDRGVTHKKPGKKRGWWGPKDEPITLYDGQHEACWDVDTYYALSAEIKRRGLHLRHPRTYPLSGLVVCQQCDNRMHISPVTNPSYGYRYIYYHCKICNLVIRETVIMPEFIKALRSKLSEFQDSPLTEPAPPVDNARAITSLKKQLDKIRNAYETTDSYTAEEYATRKREIQKDIDALQDVELQQQKQEQERKQQRKAITTVRDLLPYIEGWIAKEPAGEINVQLSQIVERVIVHPDKRVDVVLR